MNVLNMQGIIDNADVILGSSYLPITRCLIMTQLLLYNRTVVNHKLAEMLMDGVVMYW
jgi:hypothetical protein